MLLFLVLLCGFGWGFLAGTGMCICMSIRADRVRSSR